MKHTFVILFIQERSCTFTLPGSFHRSQNSSLRVFSSVKTIFFFLVLFCLFGFSSFWGDVRCNFYLWFQLGKVFFLFLSDYLKFKYNVLGVVMRAKHGRLSYLAFCTFVSDIWGNSSLIGISLSLFLQVFLLFLFFLSFWYSSYMYIITLVVPSTRQDDCLYKLLSYHIMTFCHWKLNIQYSNTIGNGAERFLSRNIFLCLDIQIVTMLLQLPMVCSYILGL